LYYRKVQPLINDIVALEVWSEWGKKSLYAVLVELIEKVAKEEG